MSNVKTLEPLSNRPDDDVVNALKGALDRAEKGDLREVVIFGTLTGREIFRHSTFDDGVLLLGALEMMKNSVIKGMEGS